MILNQFKPDPNGLRILITSTPKTGNTWLVNLLRDVYGLPVVEFSGDRPWDAAALASLGPSWICQQHFSPTEDGLAAIQREKLCVISTVRHPGDALVSYVNYLKWWREGDHLPENVLLGKDKGEYGPNALRFIDQYFASYCNLSRRWIALGAHAVRYEDLWQDPVAELVKLTDKIVPTHLERIHRAVFYCQPKSLSAAGRIDERFVHSGETQQWARALPPAALERLRGREPYTEICRQFGYTWDHAASLEPFDYRRVDPFAGAAHFENGAHVTAFLKRLYFEYYRALDRPPRPAIATGQGTFWSWLGEAPDRLNIATSSPLVITNLMACIYGLRKDLRSAYPDLVMEHRLAFVNWFLVYGIQEYALPWELVEPVEQAFLYTVKSSSYIAVPCAEEPAAWNYGFAVVDETEIPLRGANLRLKAGALLEIVIGFDLRRPVASPAVVMTLTTTDRATVFSANSRNADGVSSDRVEAWKLEARARWSFSVRPGDYYLSVFLTEKDAAGQVVPIFSLLDLAHILVVGSDVAAPEMFCNVRFLSPGE